MDYNRLLFSEISFKPAAQKTTTTNNHNTSNHNQSINGNNKQQANNHNNNADDATFQVAKHQLCDPDSVKLDWLQSEKIGGGLINVGNTCFLNSVLQCLTYCPPLYNFLVKSNGGHSSSCKLNQFCMLCEMEKHVKNVKSSNGTSVKPMSIVQRLKYINRSFQFGRQEDAHEFLRYLIDHMWKACLLNHDIKNGNKSGNNNSTPLSKLDPKIKETTMINHIFGGYHRSQVLCLTCNSRSNTFDFFMDFILDIRNAKSLEEALKRFTQPETLENENAYKCGKCRKKVAAKKKFTVYKAPNVATFQLKRFDSDRIFGGKVTKFISYPEELDLRPYMSDPTKTSIKYNLSAVLVHIGHSSNSGHYYCYIRNSNNLWYRMDDSTVSLVSLNTVLQQQAYVLFYNRKSSGQSESSPTVFTSQNHVKHEQQESSNTNKYSYVNNWMQKRNIENNHNNKEKIMRKSDLRHPSNGTAKETNISSCNHNNRNNSTKSLTNNHNNRTDTSNHNSSHNSNKSNFINSSNHNSSSNNNSMNNISSSSFTTWSGFKSKLDEDDSNKRKLDDARDKFNDELDQGKVKKIKSRNREDRFSFLSKTNHFQRFTNSYQQYTSNKRKIYNK